MKYLITLLRETNDFRVNYGKVLSINGNRARIESPGGTIHYCSFEHIADDYFEANLIIMSFYEKLVSEKLLSFGK